ncbi:MAG: hypothetical protein AB7F43_13315 [Bacteriovoracia bacterium]
MRYVRAILWHLLSLSFLVSLAAVALASPDTIPRRISFSGYLTDTSSNPITGTYNMVFSLKHNGSQFWTDTCSSVAVTNGSFSVLLGGSAQGCGNNPITATWNGFLGTQSTVIDVTINGEPIPVSYPITSAMFALNADFVDGIDGSDIVTRNPAGHIDLTTSPGTGVKVNGTDVIDYTGNWVGPGTIGSTGPTGSVGATGAAGPTGSAGPTGAAGTNGVNGVTGAQGPTGNAGPTGAAGPTGSPGANGANGATGAQGAAGTNGANGATGAQGPTGAAGPTGSPGAMGITGAQGATGPTGTLNGTTTSQIITTNIGGPSTSNAALLVDPSAGSAGYYLFAARRAAIDKFSVTGNGDVYASGAVTANGLNITGGTVSLPNGSINGANIASGSIDAAHLSSNLKVGFMVYAPAGSQTATNTTLKIDFTQFHNGFNSGSAYNLSTDTFTVPTAGVYSFSGCIIAVNIGAGGLMQAVAYINNIASFNATGFTADSPVSSPSSCISFTVYLNASDTVDLRVKHAGSGNIPVDAGVPYGTFFSGYRVY